MGFEELKPTVVYDTYWKFAAKRQEVFFNRLYERESPWTDDEIIQKYKFTNAYRASDRVSQFLIRNVIYNDEHYSPEDQCFRMLFFKLFNKIETWEYIKDAVGELMFGAFCKLSTLWFGPTNKYFIHSNILICLIIYSFINNGR